MTEAEAALYEEPFAYILQHVKPSRTTNNRQAYRTRWWLHAEARPALRRAVADCLRYLGTPRVAKHRVFVWLDCVILPDSKVLAIAFDDDLRFGILQSRAHTVWTMHTCGWHGIGNDVTYNPTTCFETFPLPQPTPAKEQAIAGTAKELNDLRERWLNPPEWTKEEVLEFPGTVGGPWNRFIDPATVNTATKLGTVRYARQVPKDTDCAKKLAKRTLTNLYNERPTWLDLAHKKLDAAVFAAYGWAPDMTDEAILTALLALNLERVPS